MSDLLLRVYHGLPAPAKEAVAGLRGAYLRRWRYGPETPGLIEQAEAQASWSSEHLARWQADQLEAMLHHAITDVPYYRNAWAARRAAGDRSSWQQLQNWPILEKDVLREQPRAFLAASFDVKHLFHEHTSGTTGKPLDLWFSRDALRGLYAAAEAYGNGWNAVSRTQRWAMIGGQLVTPVAQTRPPFWVWNRALNQLYMSSYHLSPALLPAYLDALVRYRVTYLAGYTSSLYELALAVLASGRRDLRMAVAITHAEPVTAEQRRVIAEAFMCRVSETYGMAEGVARASECAEGALHLWPQVGVVEVIENGVTASPDQTGDLVCTGLINRAMPLIRYRVGDRGAIGDPRPGCACGRQLPRLAAVEGRTDDLIFGRDGRRIGRLDTVFKSRLPIHAAQIIQEDLDRIRVRCVPAPGFDRTTRETIAQRLRDRLGDVLIDIEEVEGIPRESNGKFRAVVSKLSPVVRSRERARADARPGGAGA